MWKKGAQLGGSHRGLSEPYQQTEVDGRRMSEPYVPYGMENTGGIGRCGEVGMGVNCAHPRISKYSLYSNETYLYRS